MTAGASPTGAVPCFGDLGGVPTMSRTTIRNRHAVLTPPRTRLAEAVVEFLRDNSPQFLVDHCHRSFGFAMLIAAARAESRSTSRGCSQGCCCTI
jgi:hypothetical protein